MLDQTNWTDARVDLLKKMHAEGASCSEIAGALGTSRNAVIGKIHRLKLPANRRTAADMSARVKAGMRSSPNTIGRPRTSSAPVSRPRQPAAKFNPVGAPIPGDETVNAKAMRGPAWDLLPGSKGVSLLDHKNGQCRWPCGDPMTSGFLYCGEPVAQRPNPLAPEPVYCEHHRRLSVGG